MIEHFDHLTPEEFDALRHGITWITVLIAGADNDIDAEETEWATKLTNIRSYSSDIRLREYYSSVGEDFDKVLYECIVDLGQDHDRRAPELTKRLEALNPILAKLDPEYGAALYDSYVSFAEHVAKASGGFLRFFSVSKDEAKFLGLPMLTPIIYEPPVEDDDAAEDQ